MWEDKNFEIFSMSIIWFKIDVNYTVIQVCRTGSDNWLGPCIAITKLIQSSKAACDVLVKLPEFALPRPGTPEGDGATSYLS